MREERRVVLITGATSGIGKALAERLAESGYRVFGTVRRKIEAKGFTELLMEITDEESVRRCVERVIADAGRIDVLVNNAGMAIAGAAEETLMSEARRQFEVNFFGVFRITQLVLAGMRERGSGLILNVSSIGGIMGIPFQGLYTASKFALEGLAEALHLETSRLGIKVVVVEPGDVQTAFTAAREIHEAHKNSHYPWFGRSVEAIEYDENHGLTPEFCARKMVAIIAKKRPRFRYVISLPSQKVTVLLYRLLPYRMFAGLILQRHYKIK